MTQILMLLIIGFQLLHNGAQEQQVSTNPETELNLTLIQESIAKTSAEGFEVIEKVKLSRPQIQKYLAAKSLGAIVEDYSSGRGQFMIYPVGWAAVESSAGRWAISLYYKNEEQKYVKATWGYNAGKNVVFPLELTHATKFWVKGGAGSTRP
jgi:hypothetical protein